MVLLWKHNLCSDNINHVISIMNLLTGGGWNMQQWMAAWRQTRDYSATLSPPSQRHEHYLMAPDSGRANDNPWKRSLLPPAPSHRMLWDLRLISFQQRFMSPPWCEPPPFSLLHSVPSSCPSPSTADWHGTQWHPGHEGRPAARTHKRGGGHVKTSTEWSRLS